MSESKIGDEYTIGCKHRYATEAFKSDALSTFLTNLAIIVVVAVIAYYVTPWSLLGLLFMRTTSVKKVNNSFRKCKEKSIKNPEQDN